MRVSAEYAPEWIEVPLSEDAAMSHVAIDKTGKTHTFYACIEMLDRFTFTSEKPVMKLVHLR